MACRERWGAPTTKSKQEQTPDSFRCVWKSCRQTPAGEGRFLCLLCVARRGTSGQSRARVPGCRSRRERSTLAVPTRDRAASQTGATPTPYGVIWSHLTLLVTLHPSPARPKGCGGEDAGSSLVCFPAVGSRGRGRPQEPQGTEGCEWRGRTVNFPSLRNVSGNRK